MDPHGEFFVAALHATEEAAAAAGVGPDMPPDERLWHHTYGLRLDMVPKCVALRCVRACVRACVNAWGGSYHSTVRCPPPLAPRVGLVEARRVL